MEKRNDVVTGFYPARCQGKIHHLINGDLSSVCFKLLCKITLTKHCTISSKIIITRNSFAPRSSFIIS